MVRLEKTETDSGSYTRSTYSLLEADLWLHLKAAQMHCVLIGLERRLIIQGACWQEEGKQSIEYIMEHAPDSCTPLEKGETEISSLRREKS